jgi:hypothetical protein
MPCVSPVNSIQFDALRSQRDNDFIRATAKMGCDKKSCETWPTAIAKSDSQQRAKNGET